MADVRCPMCGKPNPPETVICKFCQARLEPLIAPSPSDSDDIGTPGSDHGISLQGERYSTGLDRRSAR
jgi:hypothetical protein